MIYIEEEDFLKPSFFFILITGFLMILITGKIIQKGEFYEIQSIRLCQN